uniref:baseplate multidomain protein megatron n=1 Tax=Mesorhizobium xinjiangense TaxID=2678685 RepID=UPI0012EEAA5E|nr:glycoside hydrolase TIM-barrel-like domain-containing protein [Mesorhizobium xinjiangense]
MATIVLQAAGAYIGGLFGTAGAAIGSAAGAIAGYLADRALIDSTRRQEGPRLTEVRPLTAEDGTPIPRVYGTMRVGGTLIWATRFEETSQTDRQGGKGGPKVTTYSYFANAAFGLCEGEIAGIRRVWADGKELDLDTITYRVHRGGESQAPDPLIEAKQGAGNAPAYRGVAYVVFDRLPLDDFGNRLPQLQFEVLRPIGALAGRVRAMALIPGATEFGYAPDVVRRTLRPGETLAVNRHVLFGASDFSASIDELQATCPNLEHVALVVTWFGDDLRAGACRIRPGVTQGSDSGFSVAWRVSGQGREDAMIVSQVDGGAAYGGTPSDRSVIEAIVDLKARGLSVTLYPFIMMDVPADNQLPDPYGGAAQAAYPWRGRITCHPGPDRPGSADKTAAAANQLAAFFGNAQPGEFQATANGVSYSGAAAEWGYRRLVLHYAHLAAAAGGVDAFLLGSELRGITALRDGTGGYPAVTALCTLAGEVRAILGAGTKLTYGADWTEYFGHQPADGSGDVFFHLDPLWAHPAIDAVGIDNYVPLSDWRDTDFVDGNLDGAATPYDGNALRGAIAGGEGFEWYYASASARAARTRSPIEDGALDVGTGEVLVRDWLRRRRSARRRISFGVAASRRDLRPGTPVLMADFDAGRTYTVEEIEEGLERRISARSIVRSTPPRAAPIVGGRETSPPALPSRPAVQFLDLPNWGDADTPHAQFRIAAWARPWRRQVVYASPEPNGYGHRTTIERAATMGYLEQASQGTCSGRVDHAQAIIVALSSGELSSISRAQLLNGGNAAAIRSLSGAWEIVQFETAEEISADVWRLTGLLRGQLGTEDAMRAGAASGAAFVLLDRAVQPAGLQASEAGLDLHWRVGPTAAELSSDLFVVETVAGGVRAARPLSPVHLRAAGAASGDVDFTWIRRSRVAADAWLEGDIPLGEESEVYRIEIRDGDGDLKRSLTATTNALTYAAADIEADFPDRPVQAEASVSQLSARFGPGPAATLNLTLS